MNVKWQSSTGSPTFFFRDKQGFAIQLRHETRVDRMKIEMGSVDFDWITLMMAAFCFVELSIFNIVALISKLTE